MDMNFYKSEVKKYTDRQGTAQGTPLRAVVRTFGCQMNAHDSEKIEAMLLDMGYVLSDDEYNADLVLYNTCCVRENAENRVYGNLGIIKGIKKEHPGMKVVVCGCMMQQDAVVERIKASYRQVDIIFGTFNLAKFPQLLYTSLETGDQIVDIWREADDAGLPEHGVRHFPYKASVNVTYGCDNYCSYCIVPYVRGHERSRAPEDILEEVRTLAADGVSEVMLLGQNVNSYGKGLAENISFAQLLRRVCSVDGIRRVRFMTSYPKDLSGELIEVLRDEPKVCKHLHLPMQSGSSEVLRRMNRRYTKEGYLRLVGEIKTSVPGIAITTDIIVGFPGETDADFEDTLDMVRQARFAGAFTFLYSKRGGTPAAAMENQVPAEVAKARFNKLLSVVNPIIYEENLKHVGQTLCVLAESVDERDPKLLSGRADDNSLVHFTAGVGMLGKYCNVKITGGKTFYLNGTAE
jgi:tRNA-2-methylthio-N6-dimethylallyladenosine synthase